MRTVIFCPNAEFQSLFYWNGLLRDKAVEEASKVTQFQSLFYWNGLLRKSPWRSLTYPTQTSFNPCSIGMVF